MNQIGTLDRGEIQGRGSTENEVKWREMVAEKGRKENRSWRDRVSQDRKGRGAIRDWGLVMEEAETSRLGEVGEVEMGVQLVRRGTSPSPMPNELGPALPIRTWLWGQWLFPQ